MHKLLIVEDEDIVIRGFKKIIDWLGLGIELVGCASNGSIAMDLIERKSPDIVLTDIKMPKSSGIDLLKRIESEKIDCKVIVISGYSDFQYMKQAIKAGVYEYMLKPVSREEINHVLGELCLINEKEKSEKQRILETRKKISENLVFMKEKLLYLLLNGTYQSDIHFVKYSDLLKNEFSYEYYHVAIFRFISIEDISVMDWGELESNIKRTVSSPDFNIIRTGNIKKDISIIIKSDSTSSKNGFEEMAIIQNILINNIDNLIDNNIKIGIGNKNHGLKGIHSSYVQAYRTLDYERNDGKNTIYYRNIKILNNDKKHTEKFDVDLDEIRNQLEKGEVSVLSNMFDLILTNNTKHGYIDLKGVKHQVTELLIFTDRTCRKLAIEIDKLYTYDSDFFQILESMVCLNDLQNWFMSLISKLKEELYGKKAHTSFEMVEEIKLFIIKNYSKEINLLTIANKYYMNHIYLSRIFKIYTGENFINYLTRIRMEKAMQLLKRSTFKVKEVASMTGYSNPYYFSKVFTKYYGRAPSEITS